jgi:ribonuclease T2
MAASPRSPLSNPPSPFGGARGGASRSLSFLAAVLLLVACDPPARERARPERRDHAKGTSAEHDAPAASFGLYVLALAWTPSFCCGHENKSQCALASDAFAATHFTLHGLWPNYTDAEAGRAHTPYPTFCGAASACKGTHMPASCAPPVSAVPADMEKYGPGYVHDDHFLAKHEWPKHGTCSGLDAPAYFRAAIDAMKRLPGEGTPDVVTKLAGGSVPLTELAASFGPRESVLLSCNASCELEQVSVCLARDGRGNPTTPVACPRNSTTASYDNGCVVRRCEDVFIRKLGACGARPAPTHEPHEGGTCNKPGQGPACTADAACKGRGFARCANSGCCTNVPR